MSRADVLMRKIREDIQIIENRQTASSEDGFKKMEDSLMSLTKRIAALGDIPHEEALPHKDELISILGMMDNLINKIESAKLESREAILEIMHKIKAQSSYSKEQEK